MPPKENPERACEECIHFFACSRQCGEPMAQRSANGCECYETVKSIASARLIERLEKERNALIEAANSRKLCEICKNDSYCFDARCTENTCDDCYQYRVCPCSNCLSHPKFEWKGLENAL